MTRKKSSIVLMTVDRPPPWRSDRVRERAACFSVNLEKWAARGLCFFNGDCPVPFSVSFRAFRG